MRKFTLLVSIICLLFIAVSSIAEENKTDLSQMSIEELITLKNNIESALYKNDHYTKLPNGYYLAGRDIAPGSYTISFFGNRDFFSATDVTIIVYNTVEAMAKYESLSNDYQNKLELIKDSAWRDSKPANESSKDDTDIPFVLPDPIDGSLYYTMCYDKYTYPNDSVHIYIDENQLLYVYFNEDYLSAIIEKTPALFMD